MALRTIRTDDDPVLRKISKPVKEVNERMRILAEDMMETMYSSQGVGLAAPQVGVLRRLIVVDDYAGNKYTMFNPEILSGEGEESGPEGCLSVPGYQGLVCRNTQVRVSYMDLTGERQELFAEGFLARILQHEIDHLDGILYTDRATKLYSLEEAEDLTEEVEIS